MLKRSLVGVAGFSLLLSQSCAPPSPVNQSLASVIVAEGYRDVYQMEQSGQLDPEAASYGLGFLNETEFTLGQLKTNPNYKYWDHLSATPGFPVVLYALAKSHNVSIEVKIDNLVIQYSPSSDTWTSSQVRSIEGELK